MTDEIGYVWQRVAADIERRIDSGELPPGSMLRGERAMAEEYGVAIDTVRRAVKDLRERGIVVTLPAKGTYVAPRPKLCRAPPWEPMGSHGNGREPMGCQSVRVRSIDRESRTPPWQQIAAHLQADIAAGKFGPDDPLPSIISLTQEFGVNRKTAHKALQYLAEQGLIEVEPGMGYYVRR